MQVKEKLDQKFAQLEEYIQKVKALRKYSKSEFNEESLIEAAAERRLYKVVQCVLDIAQIIVSNFALGEPKHYKDLFTKLGAKKIIDSELQKRLEKMAGFRNVLAHEYTYVKPKKVYQYVHKGMDDLVKFVKEIKKFVDQQKK